jgi:4-amino-4-deoxy-L-arabinose transferase-like glycosyltransferase
VVVEKLRRFEWACLAVVAAAFGVRLWYVLHPDVLWDTAWYLILAKSFGDTGTFVIPWTDPPQYNGYWPPLFPMVAAPMVKLLGAHYSTIVLSSVVASALLAVVVFLTTWDLMGRTRAFAATVLVVVTPALLPSDFRGMSETTLELAVVLLLWTFLKSLKSKWFLAPAAACAVLVYLGKPNVGAPLVALALVPVAAWRLRSRGARKVLTDPLDLTLGIAALAGIGATVALRSSKLGGVGITVIQPLRDALTFPWWPAFFLFKVAFATVFLLFATLPFSLRVRQALRAPKDEGTGYLWIFVGLSILATAVFTTSFLITENRGPLDFHTVPEKLHEGGLTAALTELFGLIGLLTDFDNVRYLSPAIVPFLWLVLPHWPFEDAKPEPGRETPGASIRRAHFLWYGLAVGSFALLLLMSPLTLDATLERLFVTLLLAAVPVVLALVARNASYDVQARVAKGGTTYRIVRARPPPVNARPVLLALGVTALAAYFFSAWFLLMSIGVVIAFGTRSPTTRVVAVAALLLCSTCVEFVGGQPHDEAAADISAKLPAGTVVGVTGIVPYFAASAPPRLTLREIDDKQPTPPYVDAVMATGVSPTFGDANFTRVQEWDGTANMFPTLAWRVAIERNLLSEQWSFPTPPVLALYVRNGTAAAHAYGV